MWGDRWEGTVVGTSFLLFGEKGCSCSRIEGVKICPPSTFIHFQRWEIHEEKIG